MFDRFDNLSDTKIGKTQFKDFEELRKIKIPAPLSNFIRILFILVVIIMLILVFVPWQQTSRGFGHITTINPSDRIQNINAPVSGRIKKWYVNDSMPVKEGEKIAEIVDNDPLIIQRLTNEKDAKLRRYEIAKIAAETAKIDYDRQEGLHKQGLSARKDYEKAKIAYKKLLSEMESALADLEIVKTKLARQKTQVIRSPKDGFIIKILAGDTSTIVKAGDKLATFAPNLVEPAIEIYVSGNDIALVEKGRQVRIQIEGLPIIQFSGWPHLSVGTFGGIVKSVDQSISENGKFRVVVVKDPKENWPDRRFLRHGTKVYGWVLLNKVKLGYEVWRKINNFPPSFDKKDFKQKQ